MRCDSALINWDQNTLTNTIKAFRDIEEGEEITVSCKWQ
jgi:hypothetical protein